MQSVKKPVGSAIEPQETCVLISQQAVEIQARNLTGTSLFKREGEPWDLRCPTSVVVVDPLRNWTAAVSAAAGGPSAAATATTRVAPLPG